MDKKRVTVGIIAALLIAFLAWLFIKSSEPLPGEKIADLGRGHVEIGTKVDYNSNPPTSGKHYGEWIKAGVYDEAKDDRNLVHSLEHGYVIMSYNCDYKVISNKSLVTSVYAHGLEEVASPSGQESSPSATLPGAFRSEECHKLVDQLISVYEKKGKHKLIVIPRPNLDAKIALTAWDYLDKFGTFDQARIENFIDAHRDQGPEKTMEP